ncbi:MAG: aldo/keto reductase [Candidatus Eisenbacteria bacterium]|jgi:aryl-alcohol dehydrogenase-like predicted oxidoreductase|nr:aldo/keto reductase [Candidatus Eisenbacteria bacterium]
MSVLRVSLGRTGLLVHPLVIGTLPMGPLQADLEPTHGGRIIRHALEGGANMIDTAAMYGSYAHINAALKGFGGEVLIASKTHAPDPATAREHVERALRALQIERLDVLHLHGARLVDPFIERGGVFDEMRRLREEGKVRFLGLSTHRIGAVRKAAEREDVDVIHPLVNREGLGIMDGTAQEMVAAISTAATAGKGIYAMKALAGGNLIRDARASLQWVRSLAGVPALAVGMLSTREVDANLALFEGRVDDELWKTLEQRTRRIRVMEVLCKGCGVCLPACPASAISIVNEKALVHEAGCILCGYCASACPEFAIRVV